MRRNEVVKRFELTTLQSKQIDMYIEELLDFNKHTNLIGKSTQTNIWERHIADCLQLSLFINKKNLKIFDLGTGGGLPGIPLSILGYRNIFMIDSVGKKIDFIRNVIKKLSLSANTEKKRIEKLDIGKADLIVSRALAPLHKLLAYSLLLSNKNTTSLFLKGRNVYNEIDMAKNDFCFDFETFKSISSKDGCVLKIKDIKVKKK